METFNFILKEKYPEKFKDVPIYDTYIFYNGVLEVDLVWANNTVPTYCSATKNNVTRIRRAAKVVHIHCLFGYRNYAYISYAK